MLALEMTASIADHRLVIQDAALPAHAEHARVIVMWESTKPAGRRQPPPALAGMSEEKGDILGGTLKKGGSAANALELLASPRFAHRPAALSEEVQQRINELRNDWGDR